MSELEVAAVAVVLIVSVVSALRVLIWIINEVLNGYLRIREWLECALNAAVESVQERLAAARGRARQQEEQASGSPLVDAVVHGDLADKNRRSNQNIVIVALGGFIVAFMIVILRSPSDPSVTLSRSGPSVGRDEGHIWARKLPNQEDDWVDWVPREQRNEIVYVKYRGEVPLRFFDCTYTPRSSFVQRVCYDRRNEYMVISLNGTYYHYCEIDAGTVSSLLSAPSIGRFYNASIKGQLDFDCRSHRVPE